MGHRQAKRMLFDGFAEVAESLGNGRRVELIDLLSQGEHHVKGLAAEIDQSVANTSFHLRALAAAGLVSTRRDGNRVYYRLASQSVADLWRALRIVAEDHFNLLDELAKAYLGDRSGLDQISREELVRRLDDGDIIVLDVRPEHEYAAGHIVGALSIPIDQLAKQVRALRTDVEIVVYCRGPFCVFADDAVRLLRRTERRVRRLEDGFPEWRNAQLPVKSSTC